MGNYIRDVIKRNKSGELCAVPSYCTASELAIRAVLVNAKDGDAPVLIEATANQVNQFGGYTGMRPADFRDFVWKIAKSVGFPTERIMLGGDHLGPLVWAKEDENSAMEKSVGLVREFVAAGFGKIHLDTSMRLGSDSVSEPLSFEKIAERGAVLYGACEKAFYEARKKNPSLEHPVFIIGSEVPIPGGARSDEKSVRVTDPADLKKTLDAYAKAFGREGNADAFSNIVGVVVQPGVEFSDGDTVKYDRAKARKLVEYAKGLDGITLEGHSTDYQSATSLREMAEDGIAILKVGPAITFGIREGLYAAGYMEEILLGKSGSSRFAETLEDAMLRNPANWQGHYRGSEDELKVKRMFSYSDRSRYYFADAEVQAAIKRLFDNMRGVEIPLGLLHQFMPYQYFKVRDGRLANRIEDLVIDSAVAVIEDYDYASGAGHEAADVRGR